MRRDVLMTEMTNEDLVELSEVMRDEDRAEVYAATGEDALTVLREMLSVSRDTYTFRSPDGSELLCCMGIRPATALGGTAMPWFLSSVYLPKYPRELLAHSRAAIGVWKQEYNVLVNFTDARYTKAIRWLSKIGFTIHPPAPYGFSQLPFHRVEIRS